MKDLIPSIIVPLGLWYSFSSGGVASKLQQGGVPLDFPAILYSLEIIEWSFLFVVVANIIMLVLEYFAKTNPRLQSIYQIVQQVLAFTVFVVFIGGFIFLAYLGLK